MPDTKRTSHVCSSGCACRSWRCGECGTAGLVDRRTRYETEGPGPDQYAAELCAQCGVPLCDSCVLAGAHRCGLPVPKGYDTVEHADGTVHAIELERWITGPAVPMWRAEVVCGRATGVSSDEGGHAALHRRAITCPDCTAILS